MKLKNRPKLELWPLVVLSGQLLSGWRSQKNYQSLPEVPTYSKHIAPQFNVWPGVSVIVPARNEQTNLPRLLDSLVQQNYPLFEVLIVDDASTDETAHIVQSYAAKNIRLLHSAGPPDGWTGKNHACWLGSQESGYPWLLFLDADTELSPLAISSALAFALEQQLQAFSLFPLQRCETFWERLLLPFAYQHYFVGPNTHLVNTAARHSLANGQFFLINRSAYQQAGGHATQAASIIDDLALATRLKEIGVIPFACRGEALVSVRMYTNLSQISQGFRKNSFLYIRQSPVTGLQTALSTYLAAAVGWLFVDALRKKSPIIFATALLSYLIQVFSARTWMKRFNVHPSYALFAPLSALAFLLIALSSMLRVITRRPLSWKGRNYKPGLVSVTRPQEIIYQ